MGKTIKDKIEPIIIQLKNEKKLNLNEFMRQVVLNIGSDRRTILNVQNYLNAAGIKLDE